MLRKFIFFINPVSGTKKKSLLRTIIRQRMEAGGFSFQILETDPEGKYAFLKNKIVEDQITDIIVCGGDGTVSSIAASLIGIDIRIGILPMGSGNGLALAAGIPRKTHKAIDMIIDGQSRWIDGFYINDRFSCMLCGIGFDARVAHEFAKQKRRGLQTYIQVTLRNFFSAKPYAFEISSTHRSFNTSAFFISIANSNQFGNNFTIAPRASLVDGLLDIVVVKKMSKLALPFSVMAQVAGFNGVQELSDFSGNRNIIYFQAPSLRIYNPEEAPVHIDGDPAGTAKTFDVRVIRHAIHLIHRF